MGKSTHQYTYEEILRMYHTHMDNYNNIIVELDRIKKSTYIKEKKCRQVSRIPPSLLHGSS